MLNIYHFFLSLHQTADLFSALLTYKVARQILAKLVKISHVRRFGRISMYFFHSFIENKRKGRPIEKIAESCGWRKKPSKEVLMLFYFGTNIFLLFVFSTIVILSKINFSATFNPLSIGTCIAKSSLVFHNFLLTMTFYFFMTCKLN